MTHKLITLILAVFLLISCSKKRPSATCVTYQVETYSSRPFKLLVMYKDSTGNVTLDVKEKFWSKEICLPEGQMASLVVTIHRDLDIHVLDTGYWYEDFEPAASAQIIHATKKVKESGSGLLFLSLFP